MALELLHVIHLKKLSRYFRAVDLCVGTEAIWPVSRRRLLSHRVLTYSD
jgi:hypothetical protein